MSTTRKIKFSFLVAAALVLIVSFTLVNCGGGGGSTPPGSVTTVYPRFAYVTDPGHNSILTYAVNAATGRLTFAGRSGPGRGPTPSPSIPAGNTPMWRTTAATMSRSTRSALTGVSRQWPLLRSRS